MKIIVDAFGGDNAPLEVIKGSRNAKDDLGVDIVLVGDKEKIFSCAAQNKISLTGIDIIDAPDVIAMTDQPGEILKSKKNCSMAVGLQALADGKGDAFVSAGSTGALVMGATFIVKRIKGVKRPAIGSVLPSNDKPFLLLDCERRLHCGAFKTVRPDGRDIFGEVRKSSVSARGSCEYRHRGQQGRPPAP